MPALPALPLAEEQRQTETSSIGIKQQLLAATWAEDEPLRLLQEKATSKSVPGTPPTAANGKPS